MLESCSSKRLLIAVLASAMSVKAAHADISWGPWEYLPNSNNEILYREGSDPNSIPPNLEYFQLFNQTGETISEIVDGKCLEFQTPIDWEDTIKPHAATVPKAFYCHSQYELSLGSLQDVGGQ